MTMFKFTDTDVTFRYWDMCNMTVYDKIIIENQTQENMEI